ncbi:efflux RND transporter periplasmic adaptor subunit [Tundrisphaera sp. TA3]|uniref:efflux RND transporter periplasmic adaptor subunit n=1 Tax=Tundrisphaera sp. TA3 TaxID=3435775 RepID=UPI003EBA18F1
MGRPGIPTLQVPRESEGLSHDSRPQPAQETTTPDAPASAGLASPASPAPPPSGREWGRAAGLAAGLLACAAAAWWAWPRAVEWFSTVRTDDAYVDGHVTLVAPRVAGQVTRVLVDNNARVRKGDLLIELDREPYREQVELKRAGVETAEADLAAAESRVRGDLALARAQRWKLQMAIEGVNNQVASLRSDVAALRSKEASRDLARIGLARTEELLRRNAASREEFDQATSASRVAEAQVRQAAEEVRVARASLGLPPDPPSGDPAEVPADLDQTFSGVRQALADLIQTIAKVGLPLAGGEATPSQFLAEFRKQDAAGDVDRIFARIVPDAPAVRQARAGLARARRELALAELDLGYCEVRAEIDGVVAGRAVNPGNHVVAGQQTMAVRSLVEVWVDCHFKETQLDAIRIGHPVDLRVDAYPGRVFRGRVSGFAPGTGAALAVLPAENATGNFVKVVQRLTVRVDLAEPNSPEAPLAAGLSVVPAVRVRETPTGPDAGARLQSGRDR